MSYAFIDGYGSILTAESSVVSGSDVRPVVTIGSILSPLSVNFSGTPSISGAVTLAGGIASVSGLGMFNVNPTGNGSVLTLNEVIRNDTVASFVGVDLTSRYMAADSAGRIVVKPFAPNEASVWGASSTVNAGDAASVVAIPAAGAGLRNYITDVFIANTGSVATRVTFTEGGGSVLAHTIAPATGGSNIIGLNAPIRNQQPNQPINVVVGTAASVLYFTVLGHKAP